MKLFVSGDASDVARRWGDAVERQKKYRAVNAGKGCGGVSECFQMFQRAFYPGKKIPAEAGIFLSRKNHVRLSLQHHHRLLWIVDQNFEAKPAFAVVRSNHGADEANRNIDIFRQDSAP